MSKRKKSNRGSPSKRTANPAKQANNSSSQSSNPDVQFELSHSSLHIGPMPDPQTMALYRGLVSDAPERLFNMAESEQRHRHEQETSAQQANINLSNAESTRKSWGLALGFLLVVAMLTLITLCVIKEQSSIAIALVTALGIIAGVFVLRKRSNPFNKKNK